MLAMFVINKIALQLAILQSHKAIPMPITHNGGSNDAAIATHATEAVISLYLRAKKATAPDASAISKSAIVGVVLVRIALFVSVNQIARVITILRRMQTPIVIHNNENRLASALCFAWTTLNENACSGQSRGAISIDQITTDSEGRNNPRMQIIAERHIITRYLVVETVYHINVVAKSYFSSFDKGYFASF